MVIFGHARFTALTDRMIRLEWATDNAFEDRNTLTAVNRHGPTPDFTVKINDDDKRIVLQTHALTLEYQETGAGFTPRNTTIRFTMNGHEKTWSPGQKDDQNLGGTVRTLDGVDGETHHGPPPDRKKTKIHLGNGLISRNGWAVVDDSQNAVIDPDTNAFTPWATPRPDGQRHDLYFLAYGLDFKGALADAATIFGSQPLPPRYTLGYWYSRYWAYTDREIEELIDQFDRMDVPIDVMVIDMDWHLPGWTGYTWDRDFFPDPDDLLTKLTSRGIKVTLNLHPADGVRPHESAFRDICQDLKLNPETTDHIPFDCTDPNYMAAYFKRLHHPEEDRGVDFWWMDWQQGEETTIPGLDPLGWLNHLHWIDQRQRRPQRRPLNFSRYSGLGSGRYPVGFSGDTYATWRSLAFQPHFTATANNVLYGTWSHDIGGHFATEFTAELYTRWVQFGVYSPILRTHTSKNPDGDRRAWNFDEPYRDAMLKALKRRYELVPYIYTELRKTEENAVSLLHPIYIEHPEADEAYEHPNQYYFGEQMIAAPITAPLNPVTDETTTETWLPHGTWWDVALGRLISGGKPYQAGYLIDETPVFVKAGSILPAQAPTRRLLPGSYPKLIVDAYPGGDGEYQLYEDDGDSTHYRDGECVWIDLKQQSNDESRKIMIGPANGKFKGFCESRKTTFHLHGCPPPEQVSLNGKNVTWSFDGDRGMIVVEAESINLRAITLLEVKLPASVPKVFTTGWRGFMRRLEKIARNINSVSQARPVHKQERLATRIAQTGNRMTRHPETVEKEITALTTEIKELPKVLAEYLDIFKEQKNTAGVKVLQKALDTLPTALNPF